MRIILKHISTLKPKLFQAHLAEKRQTALSVPLRVSGWLLRGKFLMFGGHGKKLQPETLSDYLID